MLWSKLISIKDAALIILLAGLFPSLLTAQFNLSNTGFNYNKIHLDSNNSNVLINRHQININSNTTGYWKSFQNWNEANTVAAENDSIVWVGTSIGLVRWNVSNGTFNTFSEINGVTFPPVHSVCFDKYGNLWISTTQGIIKYKEGIFTIYNNKNANLPDPYSFTWLAIDSQNNIYVAYEWYITNYSYVDGGVAKFDGIKWSYHDIANSHGTFGPMALCIYHDTLWIASTDKFYYMVGSSIKPAPQWKEQGVVSLAIDYNDNLWSISTTRKLFKYSDGGWNIIMDNFEYHQIWNDPRGGLWLTNRDLWFILDSPPYRLDFGRFNRGEHCISWLPKGICPERHLSRQFNSHCVYNTTQYFATRWGLIKVKPGSKWETFNIPKSLLSNMVYSLGTSPSGEVYLSAEMGIQKTDGIKWDSLGSQGWIDPEIKFKPDGSLWQRGLYGDFATGLECDGYDALWTAYGSIRTWGGLIGSREWLPKEMDFEDDHSPQFMDITVDKHENIWATGWYNGSVMFDRTNWHIFYSNDLVLPNSNYDRIFADSKGRIWFGTNQSSPNYGFTVYDGIQWKTFYSPGRYRISYVYQIAEDHYGNIWLATGGGLLKYDGGSFSVFDNTNSPISSNTIYAVTVDYRGNIWIGTNAGIYLFNSAAPVEVGPYSFTLSIDSMAIKAAGQHAVINFKTQNNTVPCIYQLQRSRGVHKFWTIAEREFNTDTTDIIELTDSSDLIGDYYYRIKKIDAGGRISYSSPLKFQGGKRNCTVLNFETYNSSNMLYFRWNTEDERFTKRFEIWRRTKENNLFHLIKSIPIIKSDNLIKQYEIQVDTLGHSSEINEYSLRVIYIDSSSSELKSIKTLTVLPSTLGISRNYPNPFNNSTTFNLEIPQDGLLNLKIYDILGKEVKSSEEYYDEGFYKMQVDMINQPSGIYFYTFEYSGQRSEGKFILIK